MKQVESRGVSKFLFYALLMMLVSKVAVALWSGWQAQQVFEAAFRSADCARAIKQIDLAQSSFYPLNGIFIHPKALQQRQECGEFLPARQAQLAGQSGLAIALYLQFSLRHRESFLAGAAQRQVEQILATSTKPGQLAGYKSCLAVSWAIYGSLLNWTELNVPTLVLTCARLAAQTPGQSYVADYLYRAVLTATPFMHPVLPFARAEWARLRATFPGRGASILGMAPPVSQLAGEKVPESLEPIDRDFSSQTLPLLLVTGLVGIWVVCFSKSARNVMKHRQEMIATQGNSGHNRYKAGESRTKRQQPSRRLEQQLTQLLLGDCDKAERLVNYERGRLPGKSEDWYWQTAIERLLRDRH